MELLCFFGVCLAPRGLNPWRPGAAPIAALGPQVGPEPGFPVEQHQASGIPRCTGSRCGEWFLAASLQTLGSSKFISKGLQTQLVPKHSWLTSVGSCWGQLGRGGHPRPWGWLFILCCSTLAEGCSLRPEQVPLTDSEACGSGSETGFSWKGLPASEHLLQGMDKKGSRSLRSSGQLPRLTGEKTELQRRTGRDP